MSPAPRGAAAGEVVVATSNAGKLREIREILGAGAGVLRGLGDFAAIEFPVEGDDYTANAEAKARVAAVATGRVALADDSGLEVAGLSGGPGPRSARFGGAGLDDRQRTATLLRTLAGASGSERAARFVCVVAIATPDGRVASARGECLGRIRETPSGEAGFGYDPVFELRPGVTLAQLPSEQKNRISHRALALHALRASLEALAS